MRFSLELLAKVLGAGVGQVKEERISALILRRRGGPSRRRGRPILRDAHM